MGTEFFNMIYDDRGLPTVLYICGGLSAVGALLTLVLLVDLPWSSATPFDPHHRLKGRGWLPISSDGSSNHPHMVDDPHPCGSATDEDSTSQDGDNEGLVTTPSESATEQEEPVHDESLDVTDNASLT